MPFHTTGCACRRDGSELRLRRLPFCYRLAEQPRQIFPAELYGWIESLRMREPCVSRGIRARYEVSESEYSHEQGVDVSCLLRVVADQKACLAALGADISNKGSNPFLSASYSVLSEKLLENLHLLRIWRPFWRISDATCKGETLCEFTNA